MPDRSSFTLASVVGILGFLLVTSVVTARAQRAEEAPRKRELIELIEARRGLVDDLDEAVTKLREEVTALQGEASRLTARDREAAARTAELARQAGTTPLQGAGLVVKLSNSDRDPPSTDEAGAYRIHDADLQLVVNALFAAGAEAVAINDSRIVATTAIRSAGATIVVNFRPLSPPYEVSAIGAVRREFEASDIARRFGRWAKLFGLGFSVKEQGDIEVPPYTGRVTIATADPVQATASR